MAEVDESGVREVKRIVVRKNGPYLVYGSVPLVQKAQVVSEYGEPLTWHKEGVLESTETYALCRCGHSSNKPFCDKTHAKIGFDGTETADTGNTADRQIVYDEGSGIIVRRDQYVCIESGFCGNRFTSIPEMIQGTDDTQIRAQVMAMIERCPSGSYTYSLTEDGPTVEPDLPQQIAITTEITDDGPIMGPLWVTGNIPIAHADGQPLETRNRVTLCRCGLSQIKPLCDGAHRSNQQAG